MGYPHWAGLRWQKSGVFLPVQAVHPEVHYAGFMDIYMVGLAISRQSIWPCSLSRPGGSAGKEETIRLISGKQHFERVLAAKDKGFRQGQRDGYTEIRDTRNLVDRFDRKREARPFQGNFKSLAYAEIFSCDRMSGKWPNLHMLCL
jgi:hypothetical protein